MRSQSGLSFLLLLPVLVLAGYAEADGHDDAIKILKSNKVAIFGPSNCGWSNAADKLLTKEGIDHIFFKWDKEPNGAAVFGAIFRIADLKEGRISFPITFVCGKYIGGYQDLKKKIEQVKKDIASPECKKSMDELH